MQQKATEKQQSSNRKQQEATVVCRGSEEIYYKHARTELNKPGTYKFGVGKPSAGGLNNSLTNTS